MRILAIADEESKYLWDYFQKEKLEGIDLILSILLGRPYLTLQLPGEMDQQVI